MKNNCMDCTRRHVGCHAECEDYQAYKEAYAKEKAIIDKGRRENPVHLVEWSPAERRHYKANKERARRQR